MNVTVEAGVMEASVVLTMAVVIVQTARSVMHVFVTSVSTVRSFLRSGRSSMSAIPGDTNFMTGGLTVLA